MPTSLLRQPSLIRRTAQQSLLKILPTANTDLTEAQQALLPYVQDEAKKEAQRRGLLQPLEFVFDVLQRGQYLTANIAQTITQNVREGRPLLSGTPEAVKNALTGKVKGDWETVLFGGTTEGATGDFRGLVDWRPETTAGKIARKAAGFVANVALDPTTYMSFGASTAARGAATRYGDDAVRHLISQISKNPEDFLPGLIQKGFSKKTFEELRQTGVKEAMDYLQRFAGDDITKLYSRTRQAAIRRALRTPASQLTHESYDQAIKEGRELMAREGMPEAAQRLAIPDLPKAGEQAIPGIETTQLSPYLRRPQGGPAVMFEGKTRPMQIAGETSEQYTQRLLEYLGTNPYSGAGTRAWRIFRKEFNVSERYPAWLQQVDQLRDRFKQNKVVGKFSDAIWSFLNHSQSPVANIRRALHIRNPYQKMLSVMERDVQERAFHDMMLNGEAIHAITKDLTDPEKQAVSGAMIWSQISQELAKENPQVIRASASDLVQKFATEEMDPKKLGKIIDELNGMTDEWLQFDRQALAEFGKGIGEWQDYLPIQTTAAQGWRRPGRQMTGPTPMFSRSREFGWSGHLRQQSEKIKWMFGFDEQAAADAITNGVSDVNVDLTDMLMRRAFAQSRFKQRVDMLRQFKEFGVNLASIQAENPDLYQALVGKWGNLAQLGMRRVTDPVLEGYLFDHDVADIFDKALEVTKSGPGWDAIAKGFRDFTSWWKGWATSTPGFHMRNFFSNNMTGFLKHGMEWMNPDTFADSIVATYIGLHGQEEGTRILTKLGVTPRFVNERLAKRIGDLSLGDIADYAGAQGIVSRATRGFNQPSSYSELVKVEGRMFQNLNVNPFSRQNVMTEASHQLGTYVESTARMQSMLLDLKRAVGQGANTQTALDWAKAEAKKWFLDYGDLSNAERKVIGNVIPFYTWLRGNIANQISGLAMMPEMYAVAAKAQSAVTDKSVSKEELPDWARELGMLPIGPGKDGTTMSFWPNFPYQDINMIPLRFRQTESGWMVPQASDATEMVRDIVSSSHPIVKTIAEVASGRDIFYQTDLGEKRPAPRALRVLTKMPRVVEFLDGLLRQVGYPDGLRATRDGKVQTDERGRMLLDGKIAKVLDNNLLMLDNLPMYLDLPDVIFPAVEQWKTKMTGAVDDYDALDEFFQVLSFYAGIKFRNLDLQQEEFSRNQQVIERAQAAKKESESALPDAVRRRQEWKQQQEQVQRRFRL